MEVTNKALRDLIIAHRSDSTLQLNPLSLKINGIVDAAVMGGVTNYEKVSTSVTCATLGFCWVFWI
jgi:dedicator of cytokinesis protein 1